MKKLIGTLIVILFCVISTYSQVVAPKGIRVGKSSSHTVGVLDSISTNGNKAKFYRGGTMLSPVSADTLAASSYLIFKKDSTGNAAGNYMPRQQVKALSGTLADTVYRKSNSHVTQYQFKAKSTSSNFQKALKELGANVGTIPIAMQIVGAPTSSPSMADAQMVVELIKITDSTSIGNVTYNMATVGTSVYDAYNGFGLYSISGTTASKIGETVNSATIWTVTDGAQGSNVTKAFPTSYTLVPGYYYVAILGNWGTANTISSLTCISIGNLFAKIPLTNGLKLTGLINSQASLPTTFDVSSLGTATIIPGVILY